jgi:hypothetical protein
MILNQKGLQPAVGTGPGWPARQCALQPRAASLSAAHQSTQILCHSVFGYKKFCLLFTAALVRPSKGHLRLSQQC